MRLNKESRRCAQERPVQLNRSFLCTFTQLFLVAVCFLFLFPHGALALDANSEQIEDYHSNIYLNQDGTFLVQEDIQYDFGDASKHGIFRTINKRPPQESSSFWKHRTIGLSKIRVTIDGSTTVPFTLSDSPDSLEIKIGDPHITITGSHVYHISYVVTGGYSYFSDGTAEIYWNATGNDWPVSIDQAEVTIHAGDVALNPSQACYAGAVGSKKSCDSLKQIDAQTVIFSAQNLQIGSGLTVAQSVHSNSVARVIVEGWNMIHLMIIIVPLLLVILAFVGYRYKTKYKIDEPIIAQYEPYKNFKPMYTGVLFDGKLDPRDITAGIIYLAQQGYIKIAKTERKVLFLIEVDDYQVTLLKSSQTLTSSFLKEVLSLLFPDSEQLPQAVTLSELKKNMSLQKENYAKVQALRASIKDDMRQNGFFEEISLTSRIMQNPLPHIFMMVLYIVLYVVAKFSNEQLLTVIAVMVLGVMVVAHLFVLFTSRRTKLGYEALDYLKGFKLFLSVTDKERFAFHDAPQKSPEQFMEYLPYAIAFGVEESWAKVFKGITIPNPDWYDGGSNMVAFSAMNLTASMGAFSTSFAASTSSSASSGSGGSGFSGGGGGGGGGGSW